MTANGSEKRKRTKRYTVRFCTMEDALLRMHAGRTGLSIASYIRKAALDMPPPRGGCCPSIDRQMTAQLIATMGEAAYAKLAIHCPLSALAFAASVQVDACSPNFLVQEHNEVNDSRDGGRTLIGTGFFRQPFELDSEGFVAVPGGPGLGVEIDDAGFEAIMSKPWSAARG